MSKNQKTITVTFTRETVATATIPVLDGFDPMVDTYEDIARDWLDDMENYESLDFDHDGCDVEIWNIDVSEGGQDADGVLSRRPQPSSAG